MGRVWQSLTDLYDRHPRWGAALAGSALLVGLTVFYSIPSLAPAVRVLYVLPIWLATRMGGKVAGLVLAVLSSVVGASIEWQLDHGPDEILATNMLVRFAALLILMLLISQVERALSKHQRMALTDPLTGLLNRYALKQFAEPAFNRALLREHPMTVVVIDCDGFKLLNDTHGHKAGDHVLMLLARALEDQTRQTDLVARIGGDEFAVVFQNTHLEEAKHIMERVDHMFTIAARNGGYDAGLSIGYGSASEDCYELECVLDRADRSMYEHKRRKINSVTLK